MEHVSITKQMRCCIRELSFYSKLSYDRGLVTAAGGNVSARCGDYIIMTASGISLRSVDGTGIVICDMDGKVVFQNGGLRPSKEWAIHLAIYRLRPKVDSIIHVHPPYTISYTYHGKEIPMATGSAEMKLKRVPIVPYNWPGSTSLAQAVEAVVKDSSEDIHSIVLQRHGIVCYETGMENCFNTAELTEDTARIAYLSQI